MLVAAGSVGGCAESETTPQVQGVALAQRVENAGAVRMTESGLAYLVEHSADWTAREADLAVVIPSSSSGGFPAYSVCPGGPDPNANPPTCYLEVDTVNLDLTSQPSYGITAVGPHNLLLRGRLPVRVRDLPMEIIGFDVGLSVTGNNACPGSSQTFAPVYTELELSLETDADHDPSRLGYSGLRIVNLTFSGSDLDDAIRFCASGGILSLIGTSILNLIKGFMVGIIGDRLEEALRSRLEDHLCRFALPAATPACPEGTFDVSGICRHGEEETDPCVSDTLGVEGTFDVAELLTTITAAASFELLFAAGGHSERADASGYLWGDLNPINGGLSVGLVGAAVPSATTSCYPLASAVPPSAIPFPADLLGNTVAGWPAGSQPDYAVAMSERYLNYLLAQAHDSGAFCPEVVGPVVTPAAALVTELVGAGLVAPTLDEPGPFTPAEVRLTVTPGSPLTVAVGDGTSVSDPHLLVGATQLTLDLELWSDDAFVAVGEATFDAEVPVFFMVTTAGLELTAAPALVANATVSTEGALAGLAPALEAALPELASSVLGRYLARAMPTIDPAVAMTDWNMQLEIPPVTQGEGSPGLRKVQEASDAFFAVTGSFAAVPSSQPLQSDTTAELTELVVAPEGFSLATYEAGNGPQATLTVGSSLTGATVEYQYRVDGGPWHPFEAGPELVVTAPAFRIEGDHVIEVRSREVGNAASLDLEPAQVPIAIDGRPPWLSLVRDAEGLYSALSYDRISGINTEVRTRLGHEDPPGTVVYDDWSAWQAQRIDGVDATGATVVEAEARDEAGLVALATADVPQPQADAGVPEDGGTATDAGLPADGGTPTDSGAPADTGTAADAAPPRDAGTAADATAAPDAAVPFPEFAFAGCGGCRTATGSRGPLGLLLLVLVVAVAARRR